MLNRAHPQTPTPEIQRIEGWLSSVYEDAEAWLSDDCPETPRPALPANLLVRCIEAAALPADPDRG